MLATSVLMAGCETGGSNDGAGLDYRKGAPPQGDAALTIPPAASPPLASAPSGPAERPVAMAPPDEPEGRPQPDIPAQGGRLNPLEQPKTAAPERPRRAPPIERRIAKKSEIYDPTGSHFDLLQAPREALRDLPIDANGKVDWVRALDQGLIAPRATRNGSGRMQVLDKDIIMKNTRDMPWVRFPHRQHTEWLACSNCHPRPFVEQAGANPVSMDEIFRGQYCGLCHDRVAFSVFLCERCHTEPHPGAPARWW